MLLKDRGSAGTAEKRRYRRIIVIAEIDIGEFYCTSKFKLQRMFVCPKAKPLTLTLKLNPRFFETEHKKRSHQKYHVS